MYIIGNTEPENEPFSSMDRTFVSQTQSSELPRFPFRASDIRFNGGRDESTATFF
jgi:hypothetical protein